MSLLSLLLSLLPLLKTEATPCKNPSSSAHPRSGRHDDAHNPLGAGSSVVEELADGRLALDLGVSTLDNDPDAGGYGSAAGAHGGATEVVFAVLLVAQEEGDCLALLEVDTTLLLGDGESVPLGNLVEGAKVGLGLRGPVGLLETQENC